MKYHSTQAENTIDFLEAVNLGLAKDGGLFIPERLPDLSYLISKKFDGYTDFAKAFLMPFMEGSQLAIEAEKIIEQSLNFPLIQKPLSATLKVLELFHGPTLSFKDFGARFLAQCLASTQQEKLILVATSGDTGSAVASSFDGLKGVRVAVLFPKGKISLRQQAQITCWSNNILAVEVDGVFDDCQRLVKQALADPELLRNFSLSTANSINIGRLLPQMSYYAYTAIQYFKEHHKKLNYIVPSGNLGNVTACFYAKQTKLPIGDITIATNANKTMFDYYKSGHYLARETLQTIANAMDVGDPSNFERLNFLFKNHQEFYTQTSVQSVSDQEIRAAIIDAYQRYQYLLCPHTATAYHVAHQKQRMNEQCIIATAHPAKFETIIEPIVNCQLPIPTQLKQMLNKKHHHITIEPELNQLKKVIIPVLLGNTLF